MKKALLVMPTLLIPISYAYADISAEEVKARFANRTGAYSDDRRENEHALGNPITGPGPKTGCHGDTVNTGVTITKVDVNVTGNGNVADITAYYQGKYTRQGWITPCVQSPPPNGHEDHNVYGQIHFVMKQVAFKAPEITWDPPMNVGEVGDPRHDSNVTAEIAAKNALAGAMN